MTPDAGGPEGGEGRAPQAAPPQRRRGPGPRGGRERGGGRGAQASHLAAGPRHRPASGMSPAPARCYTAALA